MNALADTPFTPVDPVRYARFGSVVRQRREALGLSQEQLAHKADINRSFAGEIERGTATPSLLTLAKLALALEVPLSVLLARCEQLD